MKRAMSVMSGAFALVAGLAVPVTAADGDTIKVSVSSDGAAGNSSSTEAAISADGRFVAFRSGATNLVAGDTNQRHDVFVHDIATREVTRVSVSSTGAQQNDYATGPAISGDGRYVAFGSGDASLVPGAAAGGIYRHDRLTGTTIQIAELPNQTITTPAISADGNVVAYIRVMENQCSPHTGQCSFDQVFVKDVAADITELVSRSTGGAQGEQHSHDPSLSADGRYVAFESSSYNLVPGDAYDINAKIDVFLRDRAAGTTTRISRTDGGAEPNAHSREPEISDDGSTVVFSSFASDLIVGDTNGRADIYRYDVATGALSLASLIGSGAQLNGDSNRPDVTGDGRRIAFETTASNAIPLDSNNRRDIVVRDLVTGAISYGTRYDGEGQPNNHSSRPSISTDGRLTVYDSSATDILRNESNIWEDVFVLVAYPWKTGRATGLIVSPPGFAFGDTGTIRRAAPSSTDTQWHSPSAPGLSVRSVRGWVRVEVDRVRSASMVAEATLSHANLPSTIVVEGARARATASCAGASGTAWISALVIDGVTVFESVQPVPSNTTVSLPGGGSVILNEQVPQPGGLLVNAVRVTMGPASVTVASALATMDPCDG